jgi:hypothetical protein
MIYYDIMYIITVSEQQGRCYSKMKVLKLKSKKNSQWWVPFERERQWAQMRYQRLLKVQVLV